MLMTKDQSRYESIEPSFGTEILIRDPLTCRAAIALVRRQFRSILLGLSVGLFAGGLFLLCAVPRYTAITQIMIDSKKEDRDTLSNGTLADLTIDTGAVDSQVELLKSEKIATAVIGDLQLLTSNDGDVSKSGQFAIITALRSWFNWRTWFGAVATSEAERRLQARDAAILYLAKNLGVRRVGRTYVLEVAFTASDPGRAAQVSGSFAKAYLDDQSGASYATTHRAGDWLLARLQDLKQKSLETDFAVQKFKSEKGLISTTKDSLVNEQQLTEINSQLIAARGEVSQAQAKLDRISAIIASGQTDAAVSEAIANPIIVELRNKYLIAAKQEAELSTKLGKDHIQVVKLRAEMQEYSTLILTELARIAESYKSALDIAMSHEKSIEAALATELGVSGSVNQDLVMLREFEREADTYKNLYQSLLQRYQETVQKQSFPVSEARIISTASVPTTPSYPNKPFVASLSVLFGGLLGAAIAGLREYADRGFRTSAQVRDALGMEFLGMLADVTSKQLAKMPKPNRSLGGLVMPPIMRYAVSAPLSGFSETLRGMKLAIDVSLGERRPKIIGVVSVLPGEGKSTVSKNFASLLSHLGSHTLLIDADLRNPGLTRALETRPRIGLRDVLLDGLHYQDAILFEPDSGLSIIPAVIRELVTHTSDLLASVAMRRLLADASRDFDYIILDLPPLAPVVDARAMAKILDCFVFVVEWGKTPRDIVASTLQHDDMVASKCIGVILNKVDFNALRLYDGYGSKEHYYGAYSQYYETSTRINTR